MGTADLIRVVIADDHRLFQEGLRLLLGREKGIHVVGEAVHGLQTIEVISKIQPDVVLLDITMPGMDGINVIGPIKQKSPATKVLILTATRDEALIFKAVTAGAKGYLSKAASVSDLLKAIQAVQRGELWIERKLMARFVGGESFAALQGEDGQGRAHGALTAREREILRLLASGGTNKDIAQALVIGEKTVKTHLNNIFRKLKVSRRLQAILYAIQQGLDSPPPTQSRER